MREPDDFSEMETDPLMHEHDEQEVELEEARIESLRRTPVSITLPPLGYSPLGEPEYDD